MSPSLLTHYPQPQKLHIFLPDQRNRLIQSAKFPLIASVMAFLLVLEPTPPIISSSLEIRPGATVIPCR